MRFKFRKFGRFWRFLEDAKTGLSMWDFGVYRFSGLVGMLVLGRQNVSI